MRRRAHVKVAEKLERLDSGILGGRGDQKKELPRRWVRQLEISTTG